jgi:hypothetical protein
MAWRAFDSYAPRRAAAKRTAAFALGCAVALIATAGGRSPAKVTRATPASSNPGAGTPSATPASSHPGAGTPSATPASSHPSSPPSATPASSHPGAPSEDFSHTPAGAASAAAAWCQTTAEAFVEGGWDSAVNAMATGAFRALAVRYEPAAALVHRRLAALHTPFALRLWPLGYAVQQYSRTTARVRVWQLSVLAISAPAADTTFQSSTVALRWADGDWKVTASPPGPDLTPPGKDAAASQVAAWVAAVNRLEGYQYVP